MSDAVSRETLRDKREDLTRTWGEREAKFKAEKAGLEHQLADLLKRFERDAIKFGAALKDLDTADRVFEIAPLSGERLLEAVLNGEHRQVEADLVGEDAPHQDPNHEAADHGSTTSIGGQDGQGTGVRCRRQPPSRRRSRPYAS